MSVWDIVGIVAGVLICIIGTITISLAIIRNSKKRKQSKYLYNYDKLPFQNVINNIIDSF